MICKKCGKEILPDALFCPTCGSKVEKDDVVKSKSNMIGDAVDVISRKIGGDFVGEKLKLTDLFSNIFKKHEKLETERLFISGMLEEKMKEEDMVSSWPKPWLFSRIFMYLLLSTLMLYFMLTFFSNGNAFTGLMFIGSCVVPLSLLVFFFETNVPRNISIISVLKYLFIGGVASLLMTLLLFNVVGQVDSIFFDAILVGIVEEFGKVIITYIIIKKVRPKYILNGILIGATIGCGFAIFESAGYAFNTLLDYGIDEMFSNILSRNILSLGGHIAWAAMAGGSIVLQNEEMDKISIKNTCGMRFWIFFGSAIFLHSVWDMYGLFCKTEVGMYIYLSILVLLAVMLILVILNIGLSQISLISNHARETKEKLEEVQEYWKS